MAQNKLRYQQGLSIVEFFDRYGSRQQCEDLVRAWRWPERFVCLRRRCSWRNEVRRQQRPYFQCGSCRYQCSLFSSPIFESGKPPLRSRLLAMHPMTRDKPRTTALGPKRRLGVSYPTAWPLKHKIVRRMALREPWRRLRRTVGIDDACLGGEVRGGMLGNGTGNLHELHGTGGAAARAKHTAFEAMNTALGSTMASLPGKCHAFNLGTYALTASAMRRTRSSEGSIYELSSSSWLGQQRGIHAAEES